MALMDLKSNLSWYGKSAPGFKPSANRADTKFGNDGASPTVKVSGYDDNGSMLSPVKKQALDSFVIDDVTFSDRGLASRAAQLGNGTKFPISPEGTLHAFDLARTGFNSTVKYEDSYGVLSGNAGLANTYTLESPIDDMYNKFNLRDDATPNSYIKHPLILRGIQREGSSDPQRFGIQLGPGVSGAFDIPRGGIVTAAERSALDAVRIGKFLVSPKGIGFLAKQFGYQLMNPNTENLLGTAIGLPATQLYNPLSAPGQVAVNGLLGSGKFTRHSGLTNLPLGGGGKYSTTKGAQRIANNLLGPAVGRMIKLYGQWKDEDSSSVWKSTVAPKGPGSILGIGISQHSRSVFTDLKSQQNPLGGLPSTALTITNVLRQSLGLPTTSIGNYYNSIFGEKFNRWNYDKNYEGESEVEVFPNGGGRNIKDTTADELDYTGYETNAYHEFPDRKPFSHINYDFRTKSNYVTGDDEIADAKKKIKDYKTIGAGPAAKGKDPDSGAENTGKRRYKTNTYAEISDKAKDRTVDTIAINNFKTNEDYITDGDEPTEARQKLSETGGGIAEAPADRTNSSKKSPEQLGYYKLTAYNAITSRAENSNTNAVENPSFTGDYKSAFANSAHTEYSALSDFGYVNYDPRRSAIEAQADSVQANPFGGTPEADLINFYFRPLRTTDEYNDERELIQFRAYINSVDDQFSPGWESNNDQGRADAKIMLSSWDRSISLDFSVPIHSADEVDIVWEKLDELARLTYPNYVEGRSFTGTYVQVTVGDLYRGVPMYVQDLSYSWDNETPWEIIEGKQVPRYTNVSMTLGWIGIQRPEYDGKAFSLNGVT